MVGDASVGKTCLLNQYLKGTLPKNQAPTIGVEFATKNVPLRNGGTVKAQIWDTGKVLHKLMSRKLGPSATERYAVHTTGKQWVPFSSMMSPRRLGKRHVASKSHYSFASVQTWMENLKLHGEADIVVMLVGNKTDLGEEAREVPTEAGRYLAEQEGFMFKETSAAANT